MKKSDHRTLFVNLLKFVIAVSVVLSCGTAIGQDKDATDEFTLEEITVTAQFQATDLQKTPIAITAITGETLEAQNILNVADLGLVIPNSDIRPQGNASGPNAQISLRGVGQADFIPAFEPGVGIYVDDVYQETLIGSTLDLLDLERIEVLRGPQGTLFGKNTLGGAIRLISKVPRGDNTGHLEVTAGTYDRLDFNGAYDFSLIDGVLYSRVSASSKRIDGYMDRLDYTCQMIANGTPELAGQKATPAKSCCVISLHPNWKSTLAWTTPTLLRMPVLKIVSEVIVLLTTLKLRYRALLLTPCSIKIREMPFRYSATPSLQAITTLFMKALKTRYKV